ncbi:MAG TPA: hypothetical protein VN681_01280 [Stellaceae bacterium]|nr:hypothetical protein [Stellaceae bacterium]
MRAALILIGVPVCAAFASSAILLAKERSVRSLLQLLGAGFLVAAVSTHVAEALDLFSGMGWGRPGSIGHYVDLVSTVAGLILLPAGYLSRRLARR